MMMVAAVALLVAVEAAVAAAAATAAVTITVTVSLIVLGYTKIVGARIFPLMAANFAVISTMAIIWYMSLARSCCCSFCHYCCATVITNTGGKGVIALLIGITMV